MSRRARTTAAGRVWSAQRGNWQIEVVEAGSPWHRIREEELLSSGMPVPFGSRCDVAASSEFSRSVFLSVLDGQGRCVGGFVIRSRPAPLVIGHSLLWVEQLGSSVVMDAAEAAIRGMRDWIRGDRRVLRLSVDAFSFDAERRHAIGRILASCGFRRTAQSGNYAETLVIDLSPSEEDIFSSLHHSARRKVRQVAKHALEVRLVDDPAFSDRMNVLLQETFRRTGGRIPQRDWAGRIALSRDNPELSRIAGLFRTDMTGPESLLAFAWGCHGVDHVFYSEAASTRDTGESRVAVAYGVMWDLIVWAKRTGARVFDMGGVTRGTHTDEDPLGGISDFKRYFSDNIVEVRDEWLIDDHSWRASVAAAVHRRVRRR